MEHHTTVFLIVQLPGTVRIWKGENEKEKQREEPGG